MRLVEPRAEVRAARRSSFAACATIASNSTTPVEKFGAATIADAGVLDGLAHGGFVGLPSRSCRSRG